MGSIRVFNDLAQSAHDGNLTVGKTNCPEQRSVGALARMRVDNPLQILHGDQRLVPEKKPVFVEQVRSLVEPVLRICNHRTISPPLSHSPPPV